MGYLGVHSVRCSGTLRSLWIGTHDVWPAILAMTSSNARVTGHACDPLKHTRKLIHFSCLLSNRKDYMYALSEGKLKEITSIIINMLTEKKSSNPFRVLQYRRLGFLCN